MSPPPPRTRSQLLLQRALTYHQGNRLGDAAASCAELRKIDPSCFDGYHLGGVIALQRGEHEQAIALLQRAVQVRPKSAVSHMCLAVAADFLGRHAQSEKHLLLATQLDPNNSEAWFNLGTALVHGGKLLEAVTAFQRSLKLSPRAAYALSALGSVFQLLGRSQEAYDHHSRALAIDPRLPKGWLSRAQALTSLSRVTEARADFEKQLSLFPNDLEAYSHRLFLLNYDATLSREAIFAEHSNVGKLVSKTQSQRTTFANLRVPAKRLRIAFLSPDLREHSVTFFLEPIVRHLDAEQFDLILYHDHFQVDEVSRRLQSHAKIWRNFSGQSDNAVEKQILEDAPDVLVELAGHSGMNRIPMLARRVAPVQITYLGYPNTTGVPAIDYRFTDAVADPIVESDPFASERLVRLARCAWTYQPPHYAPPVRERVRTSAETFTFGSFNNLAKLNQHTFSVWAQVLRAVPESQLLIKGLLLDEKRVRELTQSVGIDPARVGTLPSTKTAAEHLACYSQIDVALDTFPYSGTTTTCEALWMGVPVISLYGDRHSSRVGASLLTAVGHPEWIAETKEQFVSIAQRLAGDPNALAEQRSRLRAEMSASPLLDHKSQAKYFGEALRYCWTEHCKAHVAKHAVGV